MNKSNLSWTAYLLAFFLPFTYSAFAQDQADKPEGDGDAPAESGDTAGGGDAPASDAPADGGGDAPAADAPAPGGDTAGGGDAPAADAPAPAAGGDAPAAPAADAAPAAAPATDAAAAPAPAPAAAPAAPAGDAPAAPAPAPAAPAPAAPAPATAAPAPAPAAPAPVAPAPAPVVAAPAPPPPPPVAPPPPPPPPVVDQSALLQSNPVSKLVVASGGELKVEDIFAAGTSNITKAVTNIAAVVKARSSLSSWNSSASYSTDDKVKFNGLTYKATRDNPSSNPNESPNDWELVQDIDTQKSMKGSVRAIQLSGNNADNIDQVLNSIANDSLSNEDFENLADISIDEASSGKLAEVNDGESFDVTNITKRAEVRKKLVDKGLDATTAVDLLVQSDNNDKAGSNKGFLDSLANFDDENFDEIFSDDINLEDFELEDLENIAEEVVVADAYVEAGISFEDYKEIKSDFGDTFIDQFEAVSAEDLKVSLTAKVQSGVNFKDSENLATIVADVIETSNLIKESGGDATEFLNKLGNAVVKDINGLPLILQDGDKFTWSEQLNNLEFFIVESADDDWDYSDAPEITRIRISKDGFLYGTDSEEAAVSIPELLSKDFDYDAPESSVWKDEWELVAPSVLSLKWLEDDFEDYPDFEGEPSSMQSEALVKIISYEGNPIEIYLEFGPSEMDQWDEYFAESYDQEFLDALEAAETFDDLPASVKEFIAEDMEDRINGFDSSTFIGDPKKALELYQEHWNRQADVLLESDNGKPFLVTFQIENEDSEHWDKAVHFNYDLDGASIAVVNASYDSTSYEEPHMDDPYFYDTGAAYDPYFYQPHMEVNLAEEPSITTYTFGKDIVTWVEDGVVKEASYSVLGEGILRINDESGTSYIKPYLLESGYYGRGGFVSNVNFYIDHFEFEDGFDMDEYENFRYGGHDYYDNQYRAGGEIEMLFANEESAAESNLFTNLLLEWEIYSLFNDSDEDGVPNRYDMFPEDDSESSDLDYDGIGDNSDPDIDGDGVANNEDDFPFNPGESVDTDGDGIGDNSDPDVDGDDIPNYADADYYENESSPDEDGNGIVDYFQDDSDGDGVIDALDAFPYDASEVADADGDGLGDNEDPYPYDYDNDGYSDIMEMDDDEDGIPNYADIDYPSNEGETDVDGDGIIDDYDPFPYDPSNSYSGDPFGDEDDDGIANRFDGHFGDPDAINEEGMQDDDDDNIPNYADATHPTNVELIDLGILFDSDSDGIIDLADVDFDDLTELMLGTESFFTFDQEDVEHIENYVFHELYNDWSLSSKRKVQKTIDLINVLLTERVHTSGGDINTFSNLLDMEGLDRLFAGADSDTFLSLMVQFNAIGDASVEKKDKIEFYLNEILNFESNIIQAGGPDHGDGSSESYHDSDSLGDYYDPIDGDDHDYDADSPGEYYDPVEGDVEGAGTASKYANLLDALLSMEPQSDDIDADPTPGNNRGHLSLSDISDQDRENSLIEAGLDIDIEDINFRVLSSHTAELSGEFHDSDFDEEPKDVDLTIFASGRDTILRVNEDKINPSDPDLKITMDADNGIQNVTDAYVIASADELYLRDEWTSATHTESYADPDPYVIEVENASLALASVDTMHLINVDISTQGSLAIATLDDLNLRSTRDDDNNVFKVGENGVRNEGLFLYASNDISLDDLEIGGNVDDIYMEATTINLRNVTFPEMSAVLLRSREGSMTFGGPLVSGAVNFRNVKHLGVDKDNFLNSHHFNGSRSLPDFDTSSGRPRIEVQGWNSN